MVSKNENFNGVQKGEFAGVLSSNEPFDVRSRDYLDFVLNNLGGLSHDGAEHEVANPEHSRLAKIIRNVANLPSSADVNRAVAIFSELENVNISDAKLIEAINSFQEKIAKIQRTHSTCNISSSSMQPSVNMSNSDLKAMLSVAAAAYGEARMAEGHHEDTDSLLGTIAGIVIGGAAVVASGGVAVVSGMGSSLAALLGFSAKAVTNVAANDIGRLSNTTLPLSANPADTNKKTPNITV